MQKTAKEWAEECALHYAASDKSAMECVEDIVGAAIAAEAERWKRKAPSQPSLRTKFGGRFSPTGNS